MIEHRPLNGFILGPVLKDALFMNNNQQNRPDGADSSTKRLVRTDPASPSPAETQAETKPGKSETTETASRPKIDTSREAIETVVFVAVLVLMLKVFVAEAFIIPTGSMATTLLGYHRTATCEQCGYRFPINASDEAEPMNGRMVAPSTHAVCPLCRNIVSLQTSSGHLPPASGGDKVLVLKPQYDMSTPKRLDVIVFKFPKGPIKDFSALNYIKRLWGLPGEKLSIWHGDVFLRKDTDQGPVREIIRKPPRKILEMRRLVSDSDLPAKDLIGKLPPRWAPVAGDAMWKAEDDGKAFRSPTKAGWSWLRFRNICRPPPIDPRLFVDFRRALDAVDQSLRTPRSGSRQLLNRIATVSSELRNLISPMQESTVTARPDRLKTLVDGLDRALRLLPSAEEVRTLEGTADDLIVAVDNLRLASESVRDAAASANAVASRSQLITDLVGYNLGLTGTTVDNQRFAVPVPPMDLFHDGRTVAHWVRDLMVEFELQVHQGQGQLQVVLNAGVDRCSARFDLTTGQCDLTVERHEPGQVKANTIRTANATTPVKGAGKYRIRFCNFDQRLTLWVGRSLPFGDGIDYSVVPDNLRGPRPADLEPVGIGTDNADVTVRHLKIWRDIHYTRYVNRADYDIDIGPPTSLRTAEFLTLSADEQQGLDPWSPVSKWSAYARQEPVDYPRSLQGSRALGPNEYFALGDNSTRSSDSRAWGVVPQRLLLGKAVWVYWPFRRFGMIQ